MTLPVPYPADTRAKGWRFEIDYEKVKASDTWLRAKRGDLRGALLLLWAESWQQTPCGSLPNDDELISLLIDMSQPTFAKNKPVLMRGWWLAEDGRLYHETITSRVLDMLAKRAKDAKRSAERRARSGDTGMVPDGVTSASRVTPGGVPPETDTKHQAPSTTEAKASGKRERSAAPPDGVTESVWKDFLQIRKAKRVPMTDTALAGIRREADKAHLSLQRAIEIACERGWQSFKAEWVDGDKTVKAGVTVPGSTDPDPALLKIEADRQRAAPIPENIRAQLQTLRGNGVH